MRFQKIRQVVENLASESPIPKNEEDPSHMAIELFLVAVMSTVAVITAFLGLFWVFWQMIKLVFGLN